MVNQRGHTRSLNRYYVAMYSHAQTPGMNICCFVKCASTVMPTAAPLCHPTYWHLVRKCRNLLTLWLALELKPQLLWRWLTGSTGWWDMPVSVWNEPRSGKRTTTIRNIGHWSSLWAVMCYCWPPTYACQEVGSLAHVGLALFTYQLV